MKTEVYKTPILLITFNRLDYVKVLMTEIKKLKPKKLYVVSDGARVDRSGEDILVEDVRNYVLNHVDWNCDVKTLFRFENFGCNGSISGALDWFFNHEEQGVILEDDCIPNLSFFKYCEKMLEYYNDDKRIVGVNGSNMFPTHENEIFFSRHMSPWGWATWKRAWKLHDYDIKEKVVKKNVRFSDYYSIKNGFYKVEYKRSQGLFDFSKEWFWDQRWNYCTMLNNGLFVNPKKNLITNIGVDGTHTGSETNFTGAVAEVFDVEKLNFPDYIFPDYEHEVRVFNQFKPISYSPKRLFWHVMGKLGLYDRLLKLYKRFVL